jgi:hypothetical protein
MQNKSIYLCGSMTNLADFGTGWRKDITRFLNRHFPHTPIFDPSREEGTLHQKAGITKKDRANWNKFPFEIQDIILRKDMKQVLNKTLYVLCNFTRHSTGTVSELVSAYFHKIPIVLVGKGPFKGWVRTIMLAGKNPRVKNVRYFKTMEDFKNEIRNNQKKVATSNGRTGHLSA